MYYRKKVILYILTVYIIIRMLDKVKVTLEAFTIFNKYSHYRPVSWLLGKLNA